MTDKHLHIISFNIPYPPNYGGVIDVYNKIVALADQGVKVHLHCYQYGREESTILDKICYSVNYYPRESFYRSIYSYVPYIVGTRQSEDLLSNLVKDDHPILFEGLHTCFYLEHPELKDRIRAVRMHNIEWDYYRSLGKAERNFFRKFYFYSESRKLKKYENILVKASLVFGISPFDTEYLSQKYEHVYYIPAFHPNFHVLSKPGIGEYALYHGNLHVVENNQAAVYLIQKIFSQLDHKLIISGKDPLPVLISLVKKYPNIELRPNVSDEEMEDLILNAQIHLLPTFQKTGIKLKLLNALFNGRHVVANKPMVEDTGLEALCQVAESAEDMKMMVEKLFEIPFTEDDIALRKTILGEGFSNQSGAEKMIRYLFPPQPEPSHTDTEESSPEISL